ncbi:hypothetical protein EVAR_38653_1 [Eumeta japonica]|uniref:Uncharacterized protein n=1 Tax=Eumeta variegata TaxID=151549 RepID=A0A4C1XXU3_EUMVA|nr:hypothetical protein EVAR_38653_1 [Eumeta japonica]
MSDDATTAYNASRLLQKHIRAAPAAGRNNEALMRCAPAPESSVFGDRKRWRRQCKRGNENIEERAQCTLALDWTLSGLGASGVVPQRHSRRRIQQRDESAGSASSACPTILGPGCHIHVVPDSWSSSARAPTGLSDDN